MNSTKQTPVDWSQGSVFLQDGILYCSPNSTRPVIIPATDPIKNNSPFYQPFIMANMYHQPVWWSDAYGWLSFVPLAPTYMSTPFEPLCWMPNLVRKEFNFKNGPSLSYIIDEIDGAEWKWVERSLVDAAHYLRLWHHVPGNTPPRPSAQFRIHGPHKKSGAARNLIKHGRDWFGIWMGFMSYIVAQAKHPENWGDLMKPDPNIPVPPWYIKLHHDQAYPEDWLDGLMSSTICQFDYKTPRARIVYPLSVYDKTRPPIEWFLEHHIPVFYPWTAVEEDAVSRNPTIRYLQPPKDLVTKALDELFNNPALPMAALVMRQFYQYGESEQNLTLKALRIKYASSIMYVYITNKFYDERKRLEEYLEDIDKGKEQLESLLKLRETAQQTAARQGASLPTQGLLPALDSNGKGQLFKHVNSYFMKRHNRNQEIIAVEDQVTRARRLERERDPPQVHTTMYQWTTVRSSGGMELYMRIRVPPKRQESAFTNCDPTCRMYDALNNEWDLYSEIQDAFEDAGMHVRQSGDDWSGHDLVLHNEHRDDMEPGMQRPQTYHGDYLAPDESDYGGSISPCSSPHRTPDIESQNTRRHNIQFSSAITIDPPHRPPNVITRPQMQHGPRLLPTGPSALVNTQRCPVIAQGQLTSEVPEPRDMIQSLRFSFGYVPSLSTAPPNKCEDWTAIHQYFGFNKAEGPSAVGPTAVGPSDRDGISCLWAALCGEAGHPMPQDVSDLNDFSRLALSTLPYLQKIFRPMGNMFVFSEPQLERDCDWLLAVQTPMIALYVVRLLTANRSYTIISVAKELLTLGIPFRTLLPISVNSAGISGSSRFTSVVQPYSPTSFRPQDYIFTTNDYKAYILQCQTVLTQPQGHAALLKGGIIWRIAKQFLSIDQVLEGPSVEVTAHRTGYVVDTTRRSGFAWCNDELTADELATICGTYSIYTGRKDQHTIRSWFPPANFWADTNTTQMGCKWVEWTEKNEKFFVDIVADIKAGNQQPLSAAVWKKKFRGSNTVQALMSNAQKRAQKFVDDHIPVRDIPVKVIPAAAPV